VDEGIREMAVDVDGKTREDKAERAADVGACRDNILSSCCTQLSLSMDRHSNVRLKFEVYDASKSHLHAS
jgi:hypothetical protein